MFGRLLVLVSCLIFSLPSYAAVTGFVMNADGEVIAGARVAAYARETADERRRRLLSDAPQRTSLATAESDAKGRFSLDLPKEHAIVSLQVEAAGYAPHGTLVERDDDLGAIALTAAAERTGRITASGKPVAGARVVLAGSGEILATTDEQGRYTAADPARSVFRVTVIHPDYAILEETRRPGSTSIGTDWTLQRGVSLSGRVVGKDGKTPVADAEVRVNEWPLATTTEDGTFTAARVPATWQWIEARAGALAGERARGADLTIRLQPVTPVHGTVRDSKTQEPIAGAEVSVLGSGFFGSRTHDSTITDAKGNFTLTHVTPGSYRLLTNRPGYGFSPVSVTVAAGEKPVKTIAGTRKGRVTGLVSNEKKEPVGGARVVANATSRPDMFSGPIMMNAPGAAVTAPDGSFRLEVDPDSDVQIEAQKKGFPSARSTTLRVAPGERKAGVLITIPAGVTISGRVVDRDGNPLPGITVLPAESGGQQFGPPSMVQRMRMQNDDTLVRTAANGTFSMQLKEGTYDLAFRGDGFAGKTLRAQEVNRRTPPVEVVLDRGVEISGRVTRDGVGLADVNVGVFGEAGQESTETAADGSFRIANLTPGNLMLSAWKLDEFIQHRQAIRAPAADIVVEVPPGGRVSGRVVDAETKQPVTSFQAGLSGERSGGGMRMVGPPQLRPFTSDDGTFLLENIPAGSQTIVVNAGGYTAANVRNVQVEAGKTAELEVALDRGVTVSGRVTGPNGSPLSGVAVRLDMMRGPGIPMRMPAPPAMTEANGEYTLEAIEPGEQTLVFARTGYVPLHKKVDLSGRKARVDAQLSSGITVRGTVVNEAGAPVADAAVMASSPAAGAGGGRVRSDQNGAFEMEALAPGRYTFRADKQGYATAELRDIEISAGTPLRLTLQSGGVIFGRVTGLTPEELSQASVSAGSSSGRASAPVDPSGNYRIEGAPVGTVRVSAHAGGFVSGSRTSPPKSVEVTSGSPVQVDLEFISGSSIRGRVTRNGRPVPGARVTFFPRESQAQTTASTQSDPQGIYEVTGLADASYNVMVTDMTRMSGYSTTYEVRSSGTFDIDMRTSTVRGQVKDAGSGEPIADAAVELRQRDPAVPRFPSGSAQTDSTGTFTISEVGAGEYQLTANKPGYGAKVIELNVGDTPADVTVELAREEGISVRVVDARDGRELSASVRVYDSQNRIVHEAFMRMGGAQTIGLARGSYRAVVIVQGYATRNIGVTSPGSLVVPMTPGGTLVIRSKASEIRRARLLGADGREYFHGYGNEFFSMNPSPGVTQLERIAPGPYTVQVLGPGGEVTASAQVVVTEGGRVEVDL